jgi:hypothetical protein
MTSFLGVAAQEASVLYCPNLLIVGRPANDVLVSPRVNDFFGKTNEQYAE